MAAAPKMYTELCGTCGTEVKFDADLIRQDNPYWPWLDSRQLAEITSTVQKLTSKIADLTEVIERANGGLISQVTGLSSSVVQLNGTIQHPDGGLIAHISTLVECFRMLISPPPMMPVKPLEES